MSGRNHQTELSVAFRVDASMVIGSGHVMRCLALANRLRTQGADCHFISRSLKGNMIRSVEDAGFQVDVLMSGISGRPRVDDYASWAEVPWQQDAEETAASLQNRAADWLVLDHYGFDVDWQVQACPTGTHLLVIDDLANRDHQADVLVDANFGRRPSDYERRVPSSCKVLVGPSFSLLRPEFAALRAEVLLQRKRRVLSDILISMGGVDLPNATSSVLEALAAASLSPATRASVVLGRTAPALPQVRKLAGKMPFQTHVFVDATNIHNLMVKADLAIGAVGGTTWERAVLGLPSLMLTIAPNQEPAARSMDAADLAVWLGSVESSDWKARLQNEVKRLSNPAILRGYAERSAVICDGDGAGRVAAQIIDAPVQQRAATLADARRIWEWRHSDGAYLHYKTAQVVPYCDHFAWFKDALERQHVHFFILTKAGCPVGYTRLDLSSNREATVSLCLSGHERGRGSGRAALRIVRHTSEQLGIEVLNAEVHPKNEASLKLFRAMGYDEIKSNDTFRRFRLDVSALGDGHDQNAD